MLAEMSRVSSLESQQYPAKGPFFFAVGTDFGRPSTFSRSVFNMVKGVLLFGRTIRKTGKEWDAETADTVGVGSIDEGPGTGWARWECDTESMDDNKRNSDIRQCHTVVDIEIYLCRVDGKPIPTMTKPIIYYTSLQF
jgi:hypothetical protein